MINVYNAANSLEAHLIKNLLEQQDIPVFIQGEHLQSGVGEIPAIGLVTLHVDNSHYNQAKQLIQIWENTAVEHDDLHDYQSTGEKFVEVGRAAFYVVLGFMACIAAIYWLN